VSSSSGKLPSTKLKVPKRGKQQQHYKQKNHQQPFSKEFEHERKRKKLRSDNTTGYRGVYKKRNNFMSQIMIDKQTYHLGMFSTVEEAAEAYDHALIRAGRPMFMLNFPPEREEDEEEVSFFFFLLFIA
jgi:hypothetical protein